MGKYAEAFWLSWALFLMLGMGLLMAGCLIWVFWQWTISRIIVIILAVTGVLAAALTYAEYRQDHPKEKKKENALDD